MMTKLRCGIIGLVLVCGPALAIGKSQIRDIVLEAYPGAKVTEIEQETRKGEEVFEVDFQHGGEKFKAILSLEGDFIKVATVD